MSSAPPATPMSPAPPPDWAIEAERAFNTGARYSFRMQLVTVAHPHVNLKNENATPRTFSIDAWGQISGRSCSVLMLYLHHRNGVTVSTLQRRHPYVTLAAILDALSFAYDNMSLMTHLVGDPDAMADARADQ